MYALVLHENLPSIIEAKFVTSHVYQELKQAKIISEFTNQSACHIHRLKVDFALLGLSDVVLHPTRFAADFCDGDCSFSSRVEHSKNDSYGLSNNAFIRDMYWKMLGLEEQTKVQESEMSESVVNSTETQAGSRLITNCVPAAMQPQAVVVRAYRQSYTLVVVGDLAVASCLCM